MSNPTPITVHCRDGVTLAASLYQPTTKAMGAVMIGPATGIRRQFYHHFCSYLADNGFAVLSYDNRGIGESLHGPLRDSTASIVEWGQQDMSAALATLQQLIPNVPYHLVGHSAGGQLQGLMDNCHQLSSSVAFASSSGSLRNIRGTFLIQAQFFMNLFMPLSRALFGYANNHWLGMGEPLPAKVSEQWQRYCNGNGYIKMAFGHEVQQHHFDSLELPMLWLHASDDPIANQANVADMQAVFPNCYTETTTLIPSQHGLKQIGHMQFFSRRCRQLWPLALEWLQRHNDTAKKQLIA